MLLTRTPTDRPGPTPGLPETGDDPAALIRRVACEADRLAFAELFQHFAPRLKGFLMKGGTREGMAEEVIQETMVTIWRKAGQFDPAKASVGTWIFTIARNKRIDLIRKRVRPEPDYDDPMFQPEAEPDGEDHMATVELEAGMRDLLEQLPAAQTDVIRLTYFQNLTQVEIADRLDIPLGTVKSRLRLALERLRSLSEGVL